MKLSWGANTYSQLGHGVKSEQCVLPLEMLVECPSLRLDAVTAMIGGGGHTFMLDKQGQLFGCGWNHKGQLGLSREDEVLTLKQITSLGHLSLQQVACGWDYSMGITAEGKLHAWGSNMYGQLGLKKREVSSSETPLEVPYHGVRQVSCGLRHTAVVTYDGHVLTFGRGRKGQLGYTSSDGLPVAEAEEPRTIAGLSRVRDVACGQHYTVALTEDGRVFVWGDNRHGQLGVDPTLLPMVTRPLEIHPLEKEPLSPGCQILCGWTHTVLLTENGEVFNWGRNKYGQLGCCEYQRPVAWKPQKLEAINRVKQVAVGSEHNIALLDCGQVISWGWNEHGNCGTGTEIDVTKPTLVELDPRHKAVLVGCGQGCSFALIDDY